MNEELQNQLASLIEGAKQAGSDAASFIQEQAPGFIEQLILWEIVSNGIIAAAFLTVATALTFLSKRMFEKKDRFGDSDPAFVLLAVVAFFLVVFATKHATESAKAYFAPKVVVVEMIQRAIK